MKKLLFVFLALFTINACAVQYDYQKPQYDSKVVVAKFKPKTQKILKKIFKDNEVNRQLLADVVNTELGRKVLFVNELDGFETTGELFHTLTEAEKAHLTPLIDDLRKSFMKSNVKNFAKVRGVIFVLALDI